MHHVVAKRLLLGGRDRAIRHQLPERGVLADASVERERRRGRALGQVLSSEGNRALALIRLDRVAEALDAGDPISADDAAITVLQPAWARFKVPGAAAA